MSDIAEAAAAVQRQALKSSRSVWVAASAGTGKTKVLTDRILTLMLDGSEPSRILCLTFTRAAAAEMANRINAKLARWTTLEPGRLAQELVDLTGRYPEADEIARARQLFARILDTPGGAKIATIHAFCQSLLRRFPIEAGVPPEFAVLDERSAREMLAEAAEAVIVAARGEREPGLADALAIVARYAPEERFAELMAVLTAARGKLLAVSAAGEAGLRQRLCAALSVPPNATDDSVVATFCAAGDLAALRTACAALGDGSATDRQRGSLLARWCADPAGRPGLLDPYIAAFVTNEGTPRQTLITKAAAAKASPFDATAALAAEAERILRLQADRAGVALVAATIALVRLGNALLRAYDSRKALHGMLDYDDLVARSLELLQRPGVAPWVLFKLDGGLDHILIDEAQDTNPEQWAIVAALAEEFFAGDGAGSAGRTVFAVGDVKQSIYSFQRADPRDFARMRRHFETRITAANQDWAVVPLRISFRAAEPLLRAVDAVFRQPEAADGVALDGDAIEHVAARAGHAGGVELWPPVEPAPNEPVDPLATSDISARPAEPPTRLARAIAATITHWLATGERLESRGRSLRPGDVMVLVRRRNAFVRELLRALKQRGVPVAGVDRLTLAHEMAVRDLVALGRFLLLPEDDLTLATVLKGPLFDFSENELFLLAYQRGGETLWARLRRLGGENLAMHAAAARLGSLLARADFTPPFELYAELLGAGGGRRAMLERLGPEAEDAIEEFLALTLAYEREHVPSLQGFLQWLVAGDVEVKRDFGQHQRDEVRIMTVHGAKGLEAPVVFLPDTMQLPERRVSLLWSEQQNLPLWRPRADLAAEFYRTEHGALRARQLQEYRRLLYVALTRAQDRLYVCGWQTRRPTREAASWHALCAAGWRDIASPYEFDTRPLIGDRDGWNGAGMRLVAAQLAAPDREPPPADIDDRRPLPAWVSAPPPAEPKPPKPLIPSRPSGPEPATLSPLAREGRDRFKRGLLVHRLLQSLPQLPEADREAAALSFLALPLHGLDDDEQDAIRAETMAVLRDPAFALLWGPDAQAEVPVVGLICAPSAGAAARASVEDEGDERALSGQIDRLVVTPSRVLIIDFKTVRPAPASENDVPALYLQQLATYREALSRIYTGRRIECALLWTADARLMTISNDLLVRHLPGRWQT